MKLEKMTKSTYVQIKQMIDTVSDGVRCILELSEEGSRESVDRLEEDLRYTIEAVNSVLLYSPKVQFCRLDELDKRKGGAGYKKGAIAQYFSWLDRMTEILERQYHTVDVWDEKFVRLMDHARYVELDGIIENAKNALFSRTAEEIAHICRYYQTFYELWGTLDMLADRYDVIINRATTLKEHWEDLFWLYGRLGDQRSRLVLTSMLYNWVTFDVEYIRKMKEANYTEYFDLDLVECDAEEVVVDLGAWEGDSTLNYVQTYGKYKKIYCYEIDASSVEKMRENLCGYPDIEFRNKGAGNKNGIGYIDGEPTSTCNKITEQDTGKTVELVRLDDDITDKVTLIKMDIEGAEQGALAGCARHIQEEHPKLLISVYHNNEDIWKIPRMIVDMDPDYQLYLRSNGAQWGPAEIVLVAIDKK